MCVCVRNASDWRSDLVLNKWRDTFVQFSLHATSVTLIVDTLQEALPQQVWSLPQPVALARPLHCLLEIEAIPTRARTGEDRGTAPHGRNDSAVAVNLWDESRNGSRSLLQMLIAADTLVAPYLHTHFQSLNA